MTKPRKPRASAPDATDGAPPAADAAPAKPKSKRKAVAPPAPTAAPTTAVSSSALSPRELAAVLNGDAAPAPAELSIAEVDTPVIVAQSAPAAVSSPAAPATDAATPPHSSSTDSDDEPRAALAPDAPLAERVRMREGTADLLVFRVGGELFAASLASIEEALELPLLSHLPEMPPSMLGVISLRGRMLPAYSPARPLGVALARVDAAALVLRAGERRIALAVDDVDDVLTVELAALRPPPIVAGEERDAVLLGVAARDGALVAVLDVDALVNACLSDQALETV